MEPVQGDARFEEFYLELRRRADRLMQGQRRDHTLQATALVNEVFLKLKGQLEATEENRARCLALASRAMRHVLIDHAKGRARDKRRPEGARVLLDDVVHSYEDNAVDLLGLDEALERLAQVDETMARAVELRFFGALSVEETARVLGLSKRTFERRWQFVRTWLQAEVS